VSCLVVAGAPLMRAGIVARGLDPSILPYYMTPCRVDALAAGGLLAITVRAGWQKVTLTRLAYLLLLLGGIGLVALFYPGGLDRANPAFAIFGYSLVMIFSCGILMRSYCLSQDSMLGHCMGRGMLPFFGKYSYGLYVYHGLFFLLIMEGPLSSNAIHAFTGRYVISVFIHCVIGIFMSFGLAWLSWHMFEKHFLKLKGYFSYGYPAKGVSE